MLIQSVLRSVVLPAFLSLLSLVPVHARDWEAISTSGKIVVATEGGFFPFNYLENNKLKGYEVDIGELVAKKLGLQIEWKVLAFEAILPAVRQDRVDFAIASHAYSEDRADKVDFATPHYCAGAAIAARKNGPLTEEALKDKTIGVQIATTYFDDVKKIPGINKIKTYREEADLIKALEDKKIDAWVSDKWVIMATLDKYPDSGIQLGEQLTIERNSIILRKNNPELLNRINKIVGDLIHDGTLAKLSQKYWGRDITCKK